MTSFITGIRWGELNGQQVVYEVSKGRKESRHRARRREVDPPFSGGNPQIAKADGDNPVQTYIEAMPGWKSDVGRRLNEAQLAT